jgi:hypothetical protein
VNFDALDSNKEELYDVMKKTLTKDAYDLFVSKDFDEVLDKYGLEFVSDDDGFSVLGVEPDFDKDELTYGDQKKEAAEKLSKVLKTVPKVDFHIGSYYS